MRHSGFITLENSGIRHIKPLKPDERKKNSKNYLLLLGSLELKPAKFWHWIYKPLSLQVS